MKADVCALLKLSKQHSPSIKSIKSGKTRCENEMHNTRGSFVAAVFFTKSKSSMLEVACLEMCSCRDWVRGNPSIVRRFALLSCNQVGKKPLCGYHAKFQSCHRNRCSYWILKTFLSEIRDLCIWSSICNPLNIVCWNWAAIPVKDLTKLEWLFLCFQKVAIQIVNLFHSSRWKNATYVKKLEITVSFVHNKVDCKSSFVRFNTESACKAKSFGHCKCGSVISWDRMSSNCSVKLTSQERGSFDVANFMVFVIWQDESVINLCKEQFDRCVGIDLLFYTCSGLVNKGSFHSWTINSAIKWSELVIYHGDLFSLFNHFKQ